MSFFTRAISSMHPGITFKVAILSWLLVLITLFTFVALTLPQQQQNYLDGLRSKATSVAVSLYDVAAGAAINDDLASVVSACHTLLQGDPETSLLVVTRNNGFSLVNQQENWRVEPHLQGFWLPQQRIAQGSITDIPLIGKKLYHYAQPFDYSGIEWGWIHVGLSLERYERDVHLLYQKTIFLTLFCMVVSLVGAIFFSMQIVRPIIHLRSIVEMVADGNLSVRAQAQRRDELGILSRSINTMIKNLILRNQILETVRFCAQHFMKVYQWEEAITPVLEKIGQATAANRVGFFLNHAPCQEMQTMSLEYEWTDKKTQPLPKKQILAYANAGIEHWRDKFIKKQCICGTDAEMKQEEKALLTAQNILSFIAIPIFAEDQWLGFIRVDDCTHIRNWTAAEQDSLIAIAEILGATIIRQRDRCALLEAKKYLEQRIEHRTIELQKQVKAKEEALNELSTAQSSMLQLSRAAGMAEVATGVLHNVGNVLNSVNVSCNLIIDQLQMSKIGNIAKIADLLKEHTHDLSSFLVSDAQGSQIPKYLIFLGPVLEQEYTLFFQETTNLRKQINHIKEIVSMQQRYGHVSGIYEQIAPHILMDDTLKLDQDSLLQHKIEIKKEYRNLPPIETDKHRVLQILLNLIQNAHHACREGNTVPRIIHLRLFSPLPDFISFQVQDNGIGIATENMTRIFQYGFTTRQNGHGFGLHSGALAAKEMGGSLTVQSEGPEKGAAFTLTLPISREIIHAT